MKKMIICILLFPAITFGQQLSKAFPIDSVTNQIKYKETVSLLDNKNILYNKAKLWIVKAFNSAKDVIQLDDQTNGIIIAKGFFVIKSLLSTPDAFNEYNNNVWYTVTINIKDRKYRYIFNSFEVELHNTDSKIPLEDVLVTMSQTEKTARESIAFTIGIPPRIKKQIASLKAAMIAKDDF
jgi:hypothetical protein